jgi:acetolactate synthase-1/2/3 large subunit
MVFALLGDGTFGYHAMEIDTAMRYNLPIVTIVGNDARWNAEYQIQINTYGPDRTVGCELLPSRYDRIVQALGGYGTYVEDASDMTEAITQAVESGLPACVNVAIDGVGAPSLLR